MVRIFISLFIILLFPNYSIATNYFVDSTTGSDGDNGTTMALAWASLYYAAAQPLGAGDTIWIRRVHNEVPTSNITFSKDGTVSSPYRVIGWPRNSKTINCDWVNGSTTVDNVDSNDMDREKHMGRYIIGPDSGQYLITKVTDSNTFIIDRKYAGSTAINQNVDISKDEDYDTKPTDTASWDNDADDLPVIDFNDANFNVNMSSAFYNVLKNIEFKDSTDGVGIIYTSSARALSIIGCLIKQTVQNDDCLGIAFSFTYLERCIIEGSGAGSSQVGIYVLASPLHLKNCAIYNMGDIGIDSLNMSQIFLENVNIGVEVANGDNDIRLTTDASLRGRDVKLGGSNGYVNISTVGHVSHALLENYNKELGKHKSWYKGGVWESAVVSGETPNKKLSDIVIKITPNVDQAPTEEGWAFEIFSHEYEVDTTQRTWKYWIFNENCGTLNSAAKDDIWLELEYVLTKDDDSEYTIKKVYSTETSIASYANTDDWDYLSVANITPASASKVRIKCFISKYDVDGYIFIDPMVVNP